MRISYSSQFRKDMKTAFRQHKEILPENCRDHMLNDSREFEDCRECHVCPDWLLIYRVHIDSDLLELIRLGSHSELF